jgi:myo-inositol-1(or 4)-monophosphatase
MFTTYIGGLTLLNGSPVRVSSNNLLDNSLLATGFPYHDFSRMDRYLKLFEQLMYSSRGVRRLGSAALDLAWVACGRFDAFFEYSLHPWDVAAGALLVKQAGGIVSTFDGGADYVYGSDIVAANAQIYQELMKYIRQYFE